MVQFLLIIFVGQAVDSDYNPRKGFAGVDTDNRSNTEKMNIEHRTSNIEFWMRKEWNRRIN